MVNRTVHTRTTVANHDQHTNIRNGIQIGRDRIVLHYSALRCVCCDVRFEEDFQACQSHLTSKIIRDCSTRDTTNSTNSMFGTS